MSTPILHSAASADIGAFALKSTALTHDLAEASLTLWAGQPGVETGIWEASPGMFTATREGYHEICHLLSGRVTVTETGAEPIELAAGDLFVTPAGWSGTWHVHEQLRKVYVTIDAQRL